MKFKIKNEILKNALEMTTKAINSKVTIPIMGTVQFDFINEGGTQYMYVNASNFENTINYAIYNVEFNDRLDILIIQEPLNLKTFLTKIDNDKELIFTVHDNYTELKVGKQKIEFSTSLNKEDLLKIPEFKENLSITTNYNKFLENFKLASNFIMNDELRPVMGGVLFKQIDETVDIVSTDSQTLFKLKDKMFNNKFEFVIKPSILKLLPTKHDGDITIIGDDKYLSLQVDNIILYSRLIDSIYPNYNSVIPELYETNIIIPKDELFSKLDRASLFSNTSNMGTFSIKENLLILSTKDIDFKKSYNVVLEVNSKLPEEMNIGFNILRLMTILKTIKSEEIKIYYKDSSSALLIIPNEESDILYLLMPMAISN